MAGISLDGSTVETPRIATHKSEPVDWTPILPVPSDAPEPDFSHFKHGQPTTVWPYLDASGAVLGYCRRFDTSERKEIIPLTYCSHPTKSDAWRPKQFQAPRPLYGLDRLAKMPSNLPVLIVEGEKACDAAQRLLPNHVCISWPGGSQALHLADWTPLTGRNVTILPDADGPGLKAANTIMGLLS